MSWLADVDPLRWCRCKIRQRRAVKSEWRSVRKCESSRDVGPFGAVSSFNLPQDWKDTSTLRLGSFYRIHKSLELRGGIAIEQTPIPAKTLNPAIPGADILTLNAGLGYKWKSWSFDLGYQATFYKNRKVTNNELEGLPATGIPFLGAPGPDKYQTFINFVSIALSYRF